MGFHQMAAGHAFALRVLVCCQEPGGSLRSRVALAQQRPATAPSRGPVSAFSRTGAGNLRGSSSGLFGLFSLHQCRSHLQKQSFARTWGFGVSPGALCFTWPSVRAWRPSLALLPLPAWGSSRSWLNIWVEMGSKIIICLPA